MKGRGFCSARALHHPTRPPVSTQLLLSSLLPQCIRAQEHLPVITAAAANIDSCLPDGGITLLILLLQRGGLRVTNFLSRTLP